MPNLPPREAALAIYQPTLREISGDKLVTAAVHRSGDLLFVQDNPYDLSRFKRIKVAGAGKAASGMAAGIAEILPTDDGLVVGKELDEVPGIRGVLGSHPVPDEKSLYAAEEMLRFGESCGPDDLVIFCLGGGASALMELAGPDYDIADIRRVNELLLASGAPIETVNAVRRQLSPFKSGQLARAFSHAGEVVVLVMSDVSSSDLGAIASGILYALPNKSRQDQYRRAALWAHQHEDLLKESISRAILAEPQAQDFPHYRHFVIGSPSLLLHKAADAAKAIGYKPFPFGDLLKGEAREVTKDIFEAAETVNQAAGAPTCFIFAGETTVTLNPDKNGQGGRCQEMALAAAKLLKPGQAFLAGATDGSDGPTDAAGGLVDSSTTAEGWQQALDQHDSYNWLKRAGALLTTGPTRSNLTDLVLLTTGEA